MRMPSGHYLPLNTFLHRLDARTKIIGLFILILAIVQAEKLWSFIILFVFAFILIKIAQINIRIIVQSLKNMLIFLTFILIMNFMFYEGETVLWQFWIVTFSLEGLQQGAMIALRMIYLILVSNVLTTTTAPMEMTSALTYMLNPLRYLGVNVKNVALILNAAIQFIPTLIQDTDNIRKAQIARGARFESKKLKDRIVSVLNLATPIFIVAFKRADELAMAMESRGYTGQGQRRLKPLRKFNGQDYIAISINIAVYIVSIYIIKKWSD
ncbi:energy-coupling factor transporter transmembrane component T family protein [Fundicoccus culcitae]|uniref:Energy-coupling factor transporter transmembrane protein EcfT n=1 Tax=Fundicoccus culcitae TaxID=2969821 RepID=A0ABY5P8D2_9LACT|nr:energy-coupling factor transporter transmembrane component T [Fundicoccus culcitae]UUX34730.1 energy-coupling factor transporter transmembrane protein EcfT [Fundicoccus culcitae]